MANWGGPIFIISIFWLGWTSYPSISILVPATAGLLTGISLTFIFVRTSFPERRPPNFPFKARSDELHHRHLSASCGIGIGGEYCGSKFVRRCISCGYHCRSLEVFEIPLIFPSGHPAIRESNVRGIEPSHCIDRARRCIPLARSSAVPTPQMGSCSAQEK